MYPIDISPEEPVIDCETGRDHDSTVLENNGFVIISDMWGCPKLFCCFVHCALLL